MCKKTVVCNGIGFGIIADFDHAIGLELTKDGQDSVVAAIAIPRDQIANLIAGMQEALAEANKMAETAQGVTVIEA